MIKFIFEDGDSTPSSQLLKSAFNGCNMVFSDGCSRVFSKVMSLKSVADIESCIVFYDVSPDNRQTVAWYYKLVQDLSEADLTFPVCVIPIPCIEYYILSLFCRYSYLSCKDDIQYLILHLVEDFNWGMARKYLSRTNYHNSLERLYKFLLANQDMICLRNSNNKKNELFGKFYRENCNCDMKYCRKGCRDSVEVKAERFYTSLPVFNIVSEEHRELLSSLGVVSKNLSIEDLKLKQFRLYETMCNQLGVSSFSIL